MQLCRFRLYRDDNYESRIKTESRIVGTINKHVDIIGKETGSKKLYFLKNGYVAYPRFSSIRLSDFYPEKTYSFAIRIDKFREHKERIIIILSCGVFERTLIIPPEDIEKVLKSINVSKGNRWQFHIMEDMTLLSDRSINFTRYLNKWEILDRHKIDNMDDKIRITGLRTKIYEYISRLSRDNKKCNHLYLCNYLYGENFTKYEVLHSLRYLEEKETIYKIVYVDWYVRDIFRENDLEEESDKTLKDTFNIIKNYSRRYDWQYGIKKSDLYDKLLLKGYLENEIRNALKLLEEKKIIYKKSFIYWFTREYRGETLKGDFLEDRDKDIIYMPDKTDKIEEKDIEKKLEIPDNNNLPIEENKPKELKPIEENIFSDLPFKINFLTKKWQELKIEQEKIENERLKEIEEQKELERRREESIKRQKFLEVRISEINKQKDLLEKQFESNRIVYEHFGKMEAGEKKVSLS